MSTSFTPPFSPSFGFPYFLTPGVKLQSFSAFSKKTLACESAFFMYKSETKGQRSPILRAFWQFEICRRFDTERPTLPRCACSPPHASAHTAPCSDRKFPDMSAKPDGISCSCSVTHRYCTFQGILLHSRYHSIPLHYGRFHKSDKCNVFHWQIRPVP